MPSPLLPKPALLHLPYTNYIPPVEPFVLVPHRRKLGGQAKKWRHAAGHCHVAVHEQHAVVLRQAQSAHLEPVQAIPAQQVRCTPRGQANGKGRAA